jgi:riboflavin synthase
MFTGIIEALGTIHNISTQGTNRTFWVKSPLTGELKVDQSINHNGACLTVEEIRDGMHMVTAVKETLEKTNLGNWENDKVINLERAMMLSDRVDGHLVQGHVDATAICTDKKSEKGSWLYCFRYPAEFGALIIEKGSICIDGISLTAFDVTKDHFSVAIIPYTYHHTSIQFIQSNDTVNIEFDMLGKYVLRRLTIN